MRIFFAFSSLFCAQTIITTQLLPNLLSSYNVQAFHTQKSSRNYHCSSCTKTISNNVQSSFFNKLGVHIAFPEKNTQNRNTIHKTSYCFTGPIHSTKYSENMGSLQKKNENHATIEQVYQKMTADGKKESQSSSKDFLLTVAIGVPLWIGVLLPLTVVNTVVKSILSSSPKAASTQGHISTAKKEDTETFPDFSNLTPLKNRKYDLVLLGATGFVGKLAIEYLVRNYGVHKDMKWAIAGRNESKLEATKAEVAKLVGDDNVMKIDTIIVDTSKRSTLHNLVKDTKAVATSAGPFQIYGSSVVEFCAKYGTNYVDITGEVDWHKDMIMKWDETAQKSGAKMISFCGCDSIPWDMTVFKAAQVLSEECDDDLVEIQCLDSIQGGGASGGTIASVLNGIDGKGIKNTYDFNPLFKKADGTKSEYTVVGEAVVKPGKVKVDQFSSKYEGPFVMTVVNTEVVKRSHALRSKGNQKLKYRESAIYPDFKTAFVNWFGLIAFGTVLFTPIRGWLIPKPGEGPGRKSMERGYLSVSGFGVGSKGNKVETLLYFPREVGYFDTARMLIESALCLSLDSGKLPVKGGGFYTPSTGMGDALLDRLCKTGCMFASRAIKA